MTQPTKPQLMAFMLSLYNRGLAPSPEDVDYEWVIFDYMKSICQHNSQAWEGKRRVCQDCGRDMTSTPFDASEPCDEACEYECTKNGQQDRQCGHQQW